MDSQILVVNIYFGFKFCPYIFDTVGLRVPTRNFRDFSVFNIPRLWKKCFFAWCVRGADFCRVDGIYRTQTVSLKLSISWSTTTTITTDATTTTTTTTAAAAGGTRWRSWLRHCATSRKVAGSIPDGAIGIFHWHNPSCCTMVLGSNQPLTEMSTRNISWGVKAAGA